MRSQDIPFYWYLFPPCEGCSVLARRVRPMLVVRLHIPRPFRAKHPTKKRR